MQLDMPRARTSELRFEPGRENSQFCGAITRASQRADLQRELGSGSSLPGVASSKTRTVV
jgi:hypothetical protein